MSQFTISYSVLLWYYTPKPKGKGPPVPLLRSLIVGTIFHSGTLAMGAFLLASTRCVRIPLSYIAKQAKSGNKGMGESMSRCLNCCTVFFEKYLAFINEIAYVD